MQESYSLAFIKILPDYIDLNHKIIENRKIFKNKTPKDKDQIRWEAN